MSIRSFIYILWCLAGLAFGANYFFYALNTDAVAYLRIAEYYATGQWHLAVSGYWGPMLSWLMAPLLKFGVPPLFAARVLMAFSALVFLSGCVCVFRTFELSKPWKTAGMILGSLAAIHWSTAFITPDLLLSGLVALAASCLMVAVTRDNARLSLAAGALWGLAYLAKAVAFPLAVLTIVAFAFRQWRREPERRFHSMERALLALLAFALVAGPWVLTLSLKYGKPTFSTTAAISHTLTGPPDVDRYHPLARQFHRPEAGRVTSWEEPSVMPYHYWSPFESVDYAVHQLHVIASNVLVCLRLLFSINPAVLIVVPALMRRRNVANAAKPLALDLLATLTIPGLLLLIYLPCYVTVTEQRFFYPTFPFLFAAVYRCCAALSGRMAGGRLLGDRGKLLLVSAAVAVSLARSVMFTGNTQKVTGELAADLAARIQRAELKGPIVGSGMLPGGRSGLLVAYLIRQPWHGDELMPTQSSLANSGARLAIVRRYSRLSEQLGRDPRFQNCDDRLFESVAESEGYPLSVYEIVQ